MRVRIVAAQALPVVEKRPPSLHGGTAGRRARNAPPNRVQLSQRGAGGFQPCGGGLLVEIGASGQPLAQLPQTAGVHDGCSAIEGVAEGWDEV